MPEWLGDRDVDLRKMHRDPDGLLVQDQRSEPNRKRDFDGGDSAMKTGIAAFVGSKQDQGNLPRFESEGIMRRHPSPLQAPWDNWRNSSRDQLNAFMAGCWQAQRFDIGQRLFATHTARGFTCQNVDKDEPRGPTKLPDILDPLHLRHAPGRREQHPRSVPYRAQGLLA
jgi:hypothetical protein